MAEEAEKERPVLLSIGHSTRTIEVFTGLIETHGVTLLVDIRTVPGSRHNPQFNKETLPGRLEAAGIGYEHLAALGGLRHSRLRDSPNTGWRSPGFRNFADYMLSPSFEDGIEKLIALARDNRAAIMCAEALPWRCHRILVADALTVRGVRVEHIMGLGSPLKHELTPWARVDGTTITYPPPSDENTSPQE